MTNFLTQEYQNKKIRKKILKYFSMFLITNIFFIINFNLYLYYDLEIKNKKINLYKNKFNYIKSKNKSIYNLKEKNKEILQKLQNINEIKNNNFITIDLLNLIIKNKPSDVQIKKINYNSKQLILSGFTNKISGLSKFNNNLLKEKNIADLFLTELNKKKKKYNFIFKANLN